MLSLIAALALVAASPPADPVSLDLCRYAMLQTSTEISQSPGAVIDNYITSSKMTSDQAATQRSICAIYFLGATDLLALQAPSV